MTGVSCTLLLKKYVGIRWATARSVLLLRSRAGLLQEHRHPSLKPEKGTADGIEREFDDFRQSVFATGTLGAVNYVVRGMAELPGRKSVMLLSDGFKLFTRDAGGTLESGRVLNSLRRLVDQANRASVVVYTMDARGLQVTGLTAADDTSGRSMEDIQQAERDRRDELLDTQDGLRFLARETGGIAIVNNNDLSGGIRRILDDQSYYLVGYEPDAATFDPKTIRFNKLDVRVTRRGAKVRYRSGFIGISDENIVKPTETADRRLINALTSPFAVNDIPLSVKCTFRQSPASGSFRPLAASHFGKGPYVYRSTRWLEKNGFRCACRRLWR